MEMLSELLPSFCPFSDFVEYLNGSETILAQVLNVVNWFIPIADMIVVLETWGLAIGVWYAASIILRTVRAIQ